CPPRLKPRYLPNAKLPRSTCTCPDHRPRREHAAAFYPPSPSAARGGSAKRQARCRHLVLRNSLGTVDLLRAIQYLAQLVHERFLRKRFFDERNPGFQNTVTNNRVTRVSRHVEHSHVRMLGRQVIGQFSSAHSWHYDVGEQQMDWPVLPFGNPNGFLTV